MYDFTQQIEDERRRDFQVRTETNIPIPIEINRISTLTRAILSMDSNEQLPIDMVEQLLKFTPSAEERALLDEHSEDIDSLARADRFLYEISK